MPFFSFLSTSKTDTHGSQQGVTPWYSTIPISCNEHEDKATRHDLKDLIQLHNHSNCTKIDCAYCSGALLLEENNGARVGKRLALERKSSSHVEMLGNFPLLSLEQPSSLNQIPVLSPTVASNLHKPCSRPDCAYCR